TLHYTGSRLVKAEGVDLSNAGPNGLTGTLYVVRDEVWRDRRRVLRVERQQVVDGRVVSAQNWGEVEDAGAAAAGAGATPPARPVPHRPPGALSRRTPPRRSPSALPGTDPPRGGPRLAPTRPTLAAARRLHSLTGCYSRQEARAACPWVGRGPER